MYYVLAFIAFLCFSLGIFLMVSQKRKVTAGVICLAIGICTFIAIPIIALHSFFFSPKKTETKKEVVRLTLQDFSNAYAPSAQLFNAPAGFVLNFELGEKTDIAKAQINDISGLSIIVEKTPERKITGIIIYVGNSNDSEKMMEALMTTYAVVKIFEPKRAAESIPDFVQNLLNTDNGVPTTSRNVIYTVNQVLNNTILTIRYSE